MSEEMWRRTAEACQRECERQTQQARQWEFECFDLIDVLREIVREPERAVEIAETEIGFRENWPLPSGPRYPAPALGLADTQNSVVDE